MIVRRIGVLQESEFLKFEFLFNKINYRSEEREREKKRETEIKKILRKILNRTSQQ